MGLSWPAGAAEYMSMLTRPGSFTPPDTLVQTAIPPSLIQGSKTTIVGADASTIDYYASTDRTVSRVYGHARAGNSAFMIWALTDRWTWNDVVFTCANGAGVLGVGLNIDLAGYAQTRIIGNVGSSAVSVVVSNSTSQVHGVWYARNNLPAQASTGIFAGIDSDTLAGRFTYSLGTRATGVPVTIGAASLSVQFRVQANRAIAAFSSTGQGMSLPTDGPVFDLPSGCTCNSEEMGVIDNRVVPFGIIRAEPPYGGDDGAATVTVIGNGFRDGATVHLERVGSSSIVGGIPEVSTNGRRITARFDLRAAAQGDWDVVVVDPLGISARKSAAFRVEQGRAPTLAISIIGGSIDSRVRLGTPTPFSVNVTNLGNTDALMVPLRIHGPPANAELLLDREVTRPDPDPGAPPIDWTQTPVALSDGVQLQLPLVLTRIAPGATSTVPFRLSVPTGSSFTLAAVADAPLVGSAADLAAPGGGARLPVAASGTCNDWVQCLGGGASLAITCLAGLASCFLPGIPAECLVAFVDKFLSLLPTICNASTQSTSDQLELIGDMVLWSWNSTLSLLTACAGATLAPGLGCIWGIFSCLSSLLDSEDTIAACCKLDGACGPAEQQVYNLVSSLDPNEKTGNRGPSTLGFMSGGEQLNYVISFENVPQATAAAQAVEIQDAISPSLDLSRLEWGPIRFGSRFVVPDRFQPAVRETVDLRPSTNLLVAIDGDRAGQELTWRLQSLDPVTRQPPLDPLAGFLPPNLAPPEGEGSVGVMLRPIDGVPTGTEILNSASIVFDNNPPIPTGTVRHVVDVDAPASAITPLAATQSDSVIALSVGGSDVGSGVAFYEVHASEDEGPFVPIERLQPGEPGSYVGRAGHRYAFYSVAGDTTGNVETPPVVPDASTEIVSLAGVAEERLAFGLKAPAPNPSSGEVVVEFTLPVRSDALLRVLDVQGREIARLANGAVDAGRWRAAWNAESSGRRIAAGLYFVKLQAGQRTAVRRLVIVR